MTDRLINRDNNPAMHFKLKQKLKAKFSIHEKKIQRILPSRIGNFKFLSAFVYAIDVKIIEKKNIFPQKVEKQNSAFVKIANRLPFKIQ